MTDVFSKSKRSAVMSSVRSKGSKIELQLAHVLRHLGIRYRRHSRTLPGKPDFYFPRRMAVLFVDSCFWHGCRYHGSKPKSNRAFWAAKIAKNKKRDRVVDLAYKKMGWRVIRVWEHHLGSNIDKKVITVVRTLKRG